MIIDLRKKIDKGSEKPSDAAAEKNEERFSSLSGQTVVLSWETDEFNYYQKSKLWFLIGGLIFFLLVGYFIISEQIITSITFILLGVTVYIFSIKKPRKITCSIGYNGISVDKFTYPFKDINSFWIFFEPPEFKVISLKHKKAYLPHIQIPFGDEDPIKIRKALIRFLPEEEQEESFSDRAARYLKF